MNIIHQHLVYEGKLLVQFQLEQPFQELRISSFPTFTGPNSEIVCPSEGYVVRREESFPIKLFASHCAKFVGGHFYQVMRDVHWSTATVIPNKLRADALHD